MKPELFLISIKIYGLNYFKEIISLKYKNTKNDRFWLFWYCF